MVGCQTVLHHIRLVILADMQLVAAHIAGVRLSGRVGLDVVGRAALEADTAAGHTALDHLVRHFQRKRAVDRCDRIQRLRLRDGAREPAQDEAIFTIRLGNALLEHADHDSVRYKLPCIHKLLGRLAERCVVLDRFAQNIAGRYARHPHLFHKIGRKRAFAGARSAQ